LPHPDAVKLSFAPFCVSLMLLSACDPGVHVGWEQDFDGRVDDQCIERALRSVAPEVKRDTYVSEGSRGFPKGTKVTQFFYPDAATNGYNLDLALLPNGKTHFVHEWSKLGTDIPSDEQAQVLPLLYKANSAISRLCGLSFAGSQPKIGPG
jgi:hypothetical protein